MNQRILTNSDVLEVVLAVPSGHRHLRAVLRLRGGEEIVLQEATLAGLARAYVTIRTHPTKAGVRLVGRRMKAEEKKEEFASWQLLETE